MKTNLERFSSLQEKPWTQFAALQRKMDRLFDHFFTPEWELMGKNDFLPPCEITEEGNRYLLTMEVPGIPKDQLKIEVEGDTLTISGERNETHQGKGKQKLTERYYGSFERSFTLPYLSADKIQADYDNGVLKIVAAKTEESRSRQIQIGDRSTSEQSPPATKPEPKKSPSQPRAA